MSKRAILLGLSAIGVGCVLVYAALVWWAVNGMAAMETMDGKPPGPLHGYGVTTLLAVPGLGLLVLGGRRVALGVKGRGSASA